MPCTKKEMLLRCVVRLLPAFFACLADATHIPTHGLELHPTITNESVNCVTAMVIVVVSSSCLVHILIILVVVLHDIPSTTAKVSTVRELPSSSVKYGFGMSKPSHL